MRLLSLILIPVGLLIEALATWAFVIGWHEPVALLTILLVHLLGCAVLIVGLYLALPPTCLCCDRLVASGARVLGDCPAGRFGQT